MCGEGRSDTIGRRSNGIAVQHTKHANDAWHHLLSPPSLSSSCLLSPLFLVMPGLAPYDMPITSSGLAPSPPCPSAAPPSPSSSSRSDVDSSLYGSALYNTLITHAPSGRVAVERRSSQCSLSPASSVSLLFCCFATTGLQSMPPSMRYECCRGRTWFRRPGRGE